MSFTSMPRGLYSYDQLIAEGVYASYVATQYEKQCTAWVACRLKKLGSSYAYVWAASKGYRNATNGKYPGLTVGYTPKKGAVACSTKGNGGGGHVAFVETVYSNDVYDTSNGNYLGGVTSASDNVMVYANFKAEYFIYLDVTVDGGGGGGEPGGPSATVPQTIYGPGGTINLKAIDINFHGPSVDEPDSDRGYAPNIELYVNGVLVKSHPGGYSDEVGALRGETDMPIVTSDFYVTAQGDTPFSWLGFNSSWMDGVTYYVGAVDGNGKKFKRYFTGVGGSTWAPVQEEEEDS